MSIEYVLVPDGILLNPPIVSGELSCFELKVAFTLLAVTRREITQNRLHRLDEAAQRGIARARKTTRSGKIIRAAGSNARAQAKAQEPEDLPDTITLHTSARELLRCIGLKENTSQDRLYLALDRLECSVKLPNRGGRLKPLIQDWEKNSDGLTITISTTEAWFPQTYQDYTQVKLPLPGTERGNGANVLALHLLSHTWHQRGRKRGASRKAIMRHLGVTRWRAVERAMAALNRFRAPMDLVWTISEGEDDTVVFAQRKLSEKPKIVRRRITRKEEEYETPTLDKGASRAPLAAQRNAQTTRAVDPRILIAEWEQFRNAHPGRV